ncbi:metal-dependent hydrolase [Aliidiomarina minuta]|uniref:Metal-dependent hydrolase n=1 Tax=Aliidiomarina minuta TaxID=880057 RepID=A0A432W8X6_9GAMM|nr:amidohydrolase family protein [Aliidiomarina minuta]RUO26574.1 metal-dependent hydrolase [Aliidiomarina minuta]
MKKLLLLIILLLAILFASCPSFATSFVLNNVLLPDFETRQLNPVNVEIADGKIKQIVDIETELSHADTRDGQGQVMMPALIDMHSHSMGNTSLDYSDHQYIGIRGTANAMLYAGVHAWLDLFSDEDDIFGYRNEGFPDERNEAYVFAAGPCFTVPTGHCDFGGTRLISTPEEAVNELRDLRHAKPDVVKIVFDNAGRAPTVDEATFEAFLNEARRLNINSVVHIGTWGDVRTAARLGADAVTHLPREPMPEDIPQVMLENGTVIIPTAGGVPEVIRLHEPSEADLAASVLAIPMTDELVKAKLLRDYPVTERHQNVYDWLAGLKENDALANMRESMIALDQAGVEILVGSDSGNLAMFQGIGFHREMYFLQELGMSPWDIFFGATHKAYNFLDLDWGLEAGKPAHFTLHSEHIFEDLSLSTQVETIYLHGRKVEREPLLRYAKPGFFQYLRLFFGLEV